MRLSDPQYKDLDKLKFETIPRWGVLHRKRREAYYDCYAAGVESQNMEEFLSFNPPYIMKEYRPKLSPGESEERYKVREELSVSSMMGEIKQKRITVREKKEICDSIDKEVSDILSNLENKDTSEHLKLLWTKEITTAEGKMVAAWNRKKNQWWKDLPVKFPYEGYKSYAAVTRESPAQKTRNYETTTPDESNNVSEDAEVEIMEEDTMEEEPFITVENKKSRNRQVKLPNDSSNVSPSSSSMTITTPNDTYKKKTNDQFKFRKSNGLTDRGKPYDRRYTTRASSANGLTRNRLKDNQQVFPNKNKPKGQR